MTPPIELLYLVAFPIIGGFIGYVIGQLIHREKKK